MSANEHSSATVQVRAARHSAPLMASALKQARLGAMPEGCAARRGLGLLNAAGGRQRVGPPLQVAGEQLELGFQRCEDIDVKGVIHLPGRAKDIGQDMHAVPQRRHLELNRNLGHLRHPRSPQPTKSMGLRRHSTKV